MIIFKNNICFHNLNFNNKYVKYCPLAAFKFTITQQPVDWTHYPFMILVGMSTLGPQKCVTCFSRSAPPALWIQTESGCKQCWVFPDWFSVRCYRSRPRSKKTLTGSPSSPSSSLWILYLLTSGNWGTWCCSWGQPRSRGPKSSGCNRSWIQFSLHCAQPWRRSADFLRWSRCRQNKLLSWSLLLPTITHRHRTSTLFWLGFLHNNWLKAVWVLREFSHRGSLWGLRLKCGRPEFRWGRAVWVWKLCSLSSAISVLHHWDWFSGKSWLWLRSIK